MNEQTFVFLDNEAFGKLSKEAKLRYLQNAVEAVKRGDSIIMPIAREPEKKS